MEIEPATGTVIWNRIRSIILLVFSLSHSSLTSFLANLCIQAGLQPQRPQRVEVSMTRDLLKTDKCQHLR